MSYENMVGRRFYMPEPALEPHDESPTCYCKRCGGEIYHDGPIVTEDGRRMHMDCFEEYVVDLLRTSPSIVAECMGMKYEEAT